MELKNQTAAVITTSSRPLAKYHPNLWGDRFLVYTPPSSTNGEEELVEKLKEEVKRELHEASNDDVRLLKLVDAIQRLGIEYHFEEEIDEALQNLSQKFEHLCKDNSDMYTVALGFRLLRQHGYRVSCNIFDKFKDAEGGFKASEVMGVLEFFEATHLRVHDEDILDEANVFTRNFLESSLPSLSNPVAELVHHALHEYCNRRGLTRVEARHYISIYPQFPSHHQTLLQLAKLDFNLLQSMHKRELSELYSWSYACLDKLPTECMKIHYKAILEAFEEVEEHLLKQGTSHRHNYGIEAMKVMCRDYFAEIKWREEKYKPKSEEYMQVAAASSAYTSLIIMSFLGMGDIVTKHAFDFVLSQPNIVRAANVICRLTDDIVGHEFERQREHIPSSVECYVEEHNTSKEEAIRELKNQIEAAWKDENEAFLKPTQLPTPLLYCILNYTRAIEVIYSKGDWYTHVGPQMQNLISQLLVDPIA